MSAASEPSTRLTGATILVIEDEPTVQRALRAALVQRGYTPIVAGTRRAVELTLERRPALVLLGLPDTKGCEVVSEIRENGPMPILVLSARTAEADVVAALDRGATDYIAKPFREAELLARIRASLRAFDWTETADWSFDESAERSARRRILVLGREVKLSPTQRKLLAVLARAGGAVVTHHQILHEVWGAACVKETTALRVYMHQLREKLEPDPACPRYLLTETGVGYRLRPRSEPT